MGGGSLFYSSFLVVSFHIMDKMELFRIVSLYEINFLSSDSLLDKVTKFLLDDFLRFSGDFYNGF